jgi:hypothetical protein
MSTHGVAAVAVLLALGAGAAQAEEGMPRRKAGLWEIAMQMDGKAGAPAMPNMKSQQCVDEKSDEAMQRKAMAGGDGKSECKQTSMKRISGGVEITAECKSAEGTTSVLSKVTGDMASSYTIDNTMTFTPPRHGMSTAHMTMKASYGGACPAGMAPGEIRVGGMSFNPSQGGKGGAGMPVDIEKLKNMSPEERAKFAEEMKKAYGAGKQ